MAAAKAPEWVPVLRESTGADVYMMQLSHGALYRYRSAGTGADMSVALCFVPDPPAAAVKTKP